MAYDVLELSLSRVVTLCGMNVYPNPEYHPDRVMYEHDLLYMCEGEWTIAQDQQTYLLKPGDAIFLRAGSHHYCPVQCTPNTRTMFAHMNRLPGDRYDAEPSPGALKASAGGGAAYITTVTGCDQYPEVARILRRIIDAFWSERDDKQRQSNFLINLLINELSFIARNNQQQSDEWIVKTLRLFRTEPARLFKLEELAEMAGLSVRSMSSRFKAITGQTIHQYQMNLKLEMAYAAIRTTDRTIQDIAAGYGFYDAYQFSRLFKQKYGKSPKHFKMRDPALNINRPQL